MRPPQRPFDAKPLADLTIAIGLMNAYNRLAASFRALPASAGRYSAMEKAG